MISRSGVNRGALFSLDAALAVVLAIIVLAAASLYNASAPQATTTKQLQRVGFDVVTSLDNANILSMLNVVVINNYLVNMSSYGFKLNMSGSFPGTSLVSNQSVDFNDTVVSAVVPVTFKNGGNRYFARVRFDVWPK
ncbi:MAG: hypothetical protein Q7R96_06515 [Nanoarchaeota archaeon]|nr:hypothetical protein [Nanoarchaeota archaeon]